jgi:membrane-bound lytic murein transglycosylase A
MMMRFNWLAALPAMLLCACSISPPSLPVTSSRYQVRDWSALPGWQEQDPTAGFTAWRRGCEKLKNNPLWADTCKSASSVTLNAQAVRAFMEKNLQPLQLHNPDGSSQGLITGYYEPVYPGSHTRTDTARFPLYAEPLDLVTVSLESVYPDLQGKRLRGRLEGRKIVPYPSADAIRKNGVDSPVLAWLTDPLDVQFMQIQGSGRVKLEDGSEIRLGYANQNGHPYKPIGRWLVESQQMPAAEVSMQRIRSWAAQNPEKLDTLLASNPSYVFFRRLPESTEGPLGSLNVPLSAAHSIAVDPGMIALGSPVYLATTRPDNGNPLNVLVAAQDTGGAIRGQVRADYFWGTGPEAGELAGKMKQRGELWLLWPRNKPVPAG